MIRPPILDASLDRQNLEAQLTDDIPWTDDGPAQLTHRDIPWTDERAAVNEMLEYRRESVAALLPRCSLFYSCTQ